MNKEVIMVKVKSLDSCGLSLTMTKKEKRFEWNKTLVWSRYAEFMVKLILEYIRLGDKNLLTIEHNLVLNKVNGSFSVGYRIINTRI